MRTPNRHTFASADKAWYCIELYDDQLQYHCITSCYTTEDDASRILRKADSLAPPGMHIYYWKQDDKPVAGPPGGYEEGPLAETNK